MLPPCWGPERTVSPPILLTFRRTPHNGPPMTLQASSFARMRAQERFHRRCRHLGRAKRKRSFDGCLPFRELKSTIVTVTALSGEPSFARTLAVAIQCRSGKRRRSFGAAPCFAALFAEPAFATVLCPCFATGLAAPRDRAKVGRHLSRFARGACLRLLSRISLLALRSLCHRSSSWGFLPVKDHGSPKPRIREGEVLHSEHCSVDPSCGAMPPNSWWTVKLRRTLPSLRSAAILCKASLNSSSRKLAALTLQKHAAAQARQALRNSNDVTSHPR